MSEPKEDNLFLNSQPFGNAPEIIVSGWFTAAREFVSTPSIFWHSKQFVGEVNSCFEGLRNLPTYNDPHLTAGRYGSVRRVRGRSKEGVSFFRNEENEDLTRPYLLLLSDFKNDTVLRSISSGRTDNQSDAFNRNRQLLLSPLYFLRRMLTSPDYLTSDAYAHAVIRAEIFKIALRWPVRRPKRGSPHQIVKGIIEFENVAASIHKADAYRKNGDTFHFADQTDVVVGQLLCSMGMAYYSFAPHESKYTSQRKHELPIVGRDTFLESEAIYPLDPEINPYTYELRFVDDIDRLPSAAELINLLDGIPLPIPGADAIFAGGLRMSSKRGVVVRTSGVSGTGKTTFALGLAAALAPLGTTTCYLSCEEDPKDLAHRILTLTPPFLTRMTSRRELGSWFAAMHLDSSQPSENRQTALDFVDYVREKAASENVNLSQERAPGLVPFFVVLDGVHELITRPSAEGRDEVGDMRELVEKFRELGVFVMILTANSDDRALKELDYLVDAVITLEHENRSSISNEPQRKFVLHKTRLQYSWAGAHHLHLSKRDGVKLYPQLPAQLEPLTMWRWKPIRRQRWYDFLQTAVPVGRSTAEARLGPLVKILERSQTLIAGRGSSGKAGFALKLLSAPILPEQNDEAMLFSSEGQQKSIPRRILVASFLYPETYYEALSNSIERNTSDQSSSTRPDVQVDAISFYPGFISPEVFVSKILSRIKSADLDGVGYHGLLIDGLHNVFLQFPKLQSNSLFWPILYETLRILGLTVVTTHTQFALRGMETTPLLSADVETVTYRIGPLLQAIVNAADFYINVSRESDDLPLANVEVISALGQPIKKLPYFWNPQSMLVETRELK